MRKGWKLKSWKEVLEIRSGRNQKEVVNPKGKYRIIGSAGKIMGYADDYICEAGTTIVGRKGTINNPLFICERFWNVDTAFGLHSFEELDKHYLHYFCLGFDFSKMDRGSGRPSLVKSDLLKIQIPIPPLPEQKQIVALLDQAFAAIDQAKANIERNIENAKELFQSKLNANFSQRGDGWEEKKLNQICEVKDGTHDSPRYVDEDNGIPFVTQKNILEDGLTFEKTKFISQKDHNDFYRRSNVALNDILFSMIGANRGMACIVDDERIFSIKNVGLIKSNKNYRAKYLLYYLKSPIAKKYVEYNSSGSAQGFIGLGKLREFPIPFIELEMQKRVEKRLDSFNADLSKAQSIYDLKLEHIERLKNSILYKAFSGELTGKSTLDSKQC